MQPIIDRQLLGDAGFGLDDDTYVQVIAGLGVSSISWTSSAWGPLRSLPWIPHKFRVLREQLGDHPRMESLQNYRAQWTNQLGDSDRRVFIQEFDHRAEDVANVRILNHPDLVAIARILNHPAVGADSVFIEKKVPGADLRWQWPLRIISFPSDFEAFSLKNLREIWPSKSLVEVQTLTREQARCEVLIISGAVRDALRRILELPYRVRAGHILLLGPLDIPWHDLRSHVDALFAETQAGGLSLVSLSNDLSVSDQLNSWVNELSHNVPYDLTLAKTFPRESSLHVIDMRLLNRAALTTVARNLGRRLQRLPTNVTFSLPEKTPQRLNVNWTKAKSPADLGVELETHTESLTFVSESGSAMGLTETAAAEREARRQAAHSESARLLQGDLFELSDGLLPVPVAGGLIVGSRYRLDVFIGPLGQGAITADQAFPDELLDWREKDSYTLQVLFAEPSQWDQPLTGTLELLREGTSSKCQFVFSPTHAGLFAGRVTLHYRGRVLQTALLQTVVVQTASDLTALLKPEPLRFAIEAEIRRSLSTLDDRRDFDAWLVLNHTADGKRTMTGAGSKKGAYIASLDGIKQQLAEINRLLTQVAHKDKPYKKGLLSDMNAKLLCDLAAEGHWIYRNLVLGYISLSSAAEALRTSKYLQIVSTNLDAIVPLEFVYEYPRPKNNAPVCTNAIQALKDGHCPASCKPTQAPAPHVCPLGFWGLSKVIERHVHDPKLAKTAKVKIEPIEGRNKLSLKGSTLLAASKEVSTADRNGLERSMKSIGNGQVAAVRNWEDWRTTVGEKKPDLLLALPHAGGIGANISLEISDDVLISDYIDERYVQGDPAKRPIVLLLGCDTVNTAFTNAYARHLAVFRDAQAALVLGTVATVLGKDAAKVATKLINQLTDTVKKSPERFGEVLRQVKREAVAESLMVAMCLVAFGDADWRLE